MKPLQNRVQSGLSIILFVGLCLLSVTSNASDNNTDQRWKSAILNDDIATLQQVLHNAQDPQQQQRVHADNGKTALMIACKMGEFEFVRELLSGGADPHAETATGGTPFMFASLGGHTHIMRHLAALGVEINAKGANGWSATTIAAAKGYTAALTLLIELGADLNAADVYNWTPLMRAVDNRHKDAVGALLADTRIELDHQDESGNTALHHAVSNTDATMIKLLLEAGIDRELKNLGGQTAVQLLAGSDGVVELESLFSTD